MSRSPAIGWASAISGVVFLVRRVPVSLSRFCVADERLQGPQDVPAVIVAHLFQGLQPFEHRGVLEHTRDGGVKI